MQKITLDVQSPFSPKTRLFQRCIFELLGVINCVEACIKESSFRYVNFFVGIVAIAFAWFF